MTKGVDDEVVNGTVKSDLFDATELGSLQDDDLVLDNTTTDNDILNASVNTDTTATRIQNVETLNIQGEYVKTGFDLTNVSGTKDLNLSTKIAGGVATVIAANSLNAEAINAGTNIATLDITSLTSGTRDEVTVDAGSATTINLTGAAAGEIELDSAQLAAAGVATMAQNLGLVINASDDLEVTLSQSTPANLIGKEVTLSGNGDITLVSTDGQDLAGTAGIYDGVKVTATNTGTSTVAIDSLVITNADFSKAAVDVISLTGGTAGAPAVVTLTGTDVVINENTTLNLAANLNTSALAATAADITINVDNGNPNTVFTTGTAMLTISEVQNNVFATSPTGATTIITGATVDTLLISASADEVTDYDADENGYNEISSMVVDSVTLSAALTTAGAGTAIDTSTDVMVIQGTENMTFNNITIMNYGQVISAASFEGDLTINAVTDSDVGATANTAKFVTIVGGKGDDFIITGAAAKFDVQAMYGNNIINVAAAAAGTKVTTGTGADYITSSINATTIKAGAGNDTVVAAGNDTIWTQDGSDKIKVGAGTVGATVTVKDFVKGTDTVVLNGGTAVANIRLDNLYVSNGAYIVADAAVAGTLGANEWGITLENGGTALSAKDMRDSIQVSSVTLFDGSINVLGDKDDSVIVLGDESATITLGGGNDSVELATSVTAVATSTIKDFTVGEDKIIITTTGTDTTITNVNLKNVDSTLGVYSIGDTTVGAGFKLENGGANIVTNNDLESMVQLGKATAAFVVENTALAGALADSTVSVSGGIFNDVVKLVVIPNTGAAVTNKIVYNFKDNGGVDTVIMDDNVAGTATNAADGSYVDFNQITGIDTITDSANKKVGLAANAAKVADAKDTAVYVFANSSDGTGTAEITTFLTHTANGYTQDVIDDEVAAFINAGLGVQNGENYIVVINDKSSATYKGAVGGGSDGGYAYDSYVYLVSGDADGVQADNITLIGMLDDGSGVAGDTVFTALDIA